MLRTPSYQIFSRRDRPYDADFEAFFPHLLWAVRAEPFKNAPPDSLWFLSYLLLEELDMLSKDRRAQTVSTGWIWGLLLLQKVIDGINSTLNLSTGRSFCHWQRWKQMNLNLLKPNTSADKPITEDKPCTTWVMVPRAPETAVNV